jgi:hypothetical protein
VLATLVDLLGRFTDANGDECAAEVGAPGHQVG